jgi:hypothetical protein
VDSAPTPNQLWKVKTLQEFTTVSKTWVFLIINCQNFINNYNYYGSGFEGKKKKEKKKKKIQHLSVKPEKVLW